MRRAAALKKGYSGGIKSALSFHPEGYRVTSIGNPMLDPLYPFGPLGPLPLFLLMCVVLLVCEAVSWMLRRFTTWAPSADSIAGTIVMLLWPAVIITAIWLAIRD